MTREAQPEGSRRLDPASSGQWRLRASFAECVRLQSLADRSRDVSEELRLCAREARQKGTKPEEIVVALRTAWREFVNPDSRAPDPRLIQLIGLALDAYFADTADRAEF